MTNRVLFTKKLSSAALTLASQHGIEVIEEEMIIVKPREANTITPTLQNIPESSVVVFTSRNAVKAVADAGGLTKPMRIYAVAESTAEAVKERLNADAIFGTTNAEGLASMIIQREHAGDVFFFCGNERRDTLPRKLRDAGFEVNEVVVYDTRRSARKLDINFDAIAFFSPSAVQSYFGMNKLPQGVVCYSIGETTTQELTRFTTDKILTSNEPSEKCLLQLIIARANNSR